jgi:hypothetical protein
VNTAANFQRDSNNGAKLPTAVSTRVHMLEMEAASLNDVAAQYGSVVGRMAVMTHSNFECAHE